MPDVVDGSLVFYTPKQRLEIGITTYATNQEQIAGGGDNEFVDQLEEKEAATVPANTTSVGIDTSSNEGEYFQPPIITESSRDTMTDGTTLDGDEFQGGTGRGGKGFGSIIYNSDANRLEIFVPVAGGSGIGTWCGIGTIA